MDTLGKQKSATEQLSEKNAPYAKANIDPCSRLAVAYYANQKGLKVQLGSDKLLGIPLETYIPSEKLAIEFTNGSEHMEVLKSHLCKQRNIKLVKLPFKTTETEAEYADRVKAVFKSVHIFIYSDVEADVSVIRAKFNEWRKRL